MNVDISDLPDELRQRVVRQLRIARMNEQYLMTYKEAAEIYGYSYQSIRTYVAQRRLGVVHTNRGPRLTHASMRAYRSTLSGTGRPLKAREDA